MGNTLSQVMTRLPWHERLAIRAMKFMLYLPTDEDAIKVCLAVWHCGWPRVRKALKDTARQGSPVRWATIRHDLPCPTVAYVENKLMNMMEEKQQCYEAF